MTSLALDPDALGQLGFNFLLFFSCAQVLPRLQLLRLYLDYAFFSSCCLSLGYPTLYLLHLISWYCCILVVLPSDGWQALRPGSGKHNSVFSPCTRPMHHERAHTGR